jgi:S-DNA-T family DNA segregation ATPase FtsK/SpoIIIE
VQTAETPAAGPIAVTSRADDNRPGKTTMPKLAGSFKLPSTALLRRPDEHSTIDEEELKTTAQVLQEKYGEFDVRGQVTQINPGPVVTTFEFKPEAGIKYSRVTGLSDDLCLALRAESILIERMAGKSTVGIQVPNRERETIWLREVVESQEFLGGKSKLTLALGKDINGRIVTADLNTMPHLLIAGSTGSGKSVAVNAFIMSILYKATPDEARLILVDPKRLELGNYEGVPHLYTPIITEPKLASNALRNAVREMERRLKVLAEKGVRNIDQYNKLFDGGTPNLFEDGSEAKPLPYIVIIIDELADLMMLDGQNVEASITRLAQMARAVGIHLVLATQRPSVDVITGLIKANFPARMSFRVATKIDSRTILDANGAEALLGRGDMLYLPNGSARVHRVHAPFVTEKEIASVVEFWKAQGAAQYQEQFLQAPKEDGDGVGGSSGGDSGANENDELFQDAVRIVLEYGKASTSLLQRRLRVGYGRAAHLIDLMERDGIVGAADGPKPRELLKRPDWLSEVEDAMR